MKRVIFTIILSLLLLIVITQNVNAVDLILDYPDIRGIGKLGEGEAATLPGAIKYIFLFALGLVGFVALLAMMIAAVLYVTSAGNPSRMGDAKDRIMAAILGIIILLASVLILRTISPDLVNLNISMPEINPQNGGGNGGGSGPNRACLCWLTQNAGYALKTCYPTQSDCSLYCNAYCLADGYVKGTCSTHNTCK